MRLVAWLQVALLLCALAPTPLEAGSRKAKSLYAKSRAAELQHEYDRALALAEEAMIEDPDDHRYELAVRRLRFVAGQAHVDVGRRLRDEGRLEEAVAEFERAVAIDPASTVAAQQLKRTLELIAKRDGTEGEDPDDLSASAIETDRRQREEMVESLKSPVRLKPISSQPIDLTMSETAQVVFETIGKLAGINVLFDPAFSADKKIDISIQRATLTEALDYVSLIAETYWKPITENAIFVTRDDTNNRRKFEEEVVKTIYLNNVATPQELQEITTAIRGLTDIRRMFPVSSMNAIILRGTEAKLALAEKVIHDIDKARPEVVIDVLVLEASRTRTQELGINPGPGGFDIPITFNRGAGEDGGGSVRLSDLGSIGSRDWVTSLPSARIAALFGSSDTNLLQSPRIRASDGAQASLRIGDRIPVATGSFQPGVGGVGINPLVNTQFQYQDVGVNVDIQPKVHNDREVSMHVEIEISNVRDFTDIGGIQQPIIGQRTIAHDIRIEEGEASILGGLNQGQVFKTKSGVPFLSEIPILGRLFSITRVEDNENEILIVLIPHIVRLPTIDESNLKSIASGTDQTFQVRYEEDGNGEAALPPPGQAIEPQPQQPAPAAPVAQTPPPFEQPGTQPAPEQPTPQPQQPAQQPQQPAQQPEQPAPAAGPRLSLAPANPTVGVDQELTLAVRIDAAEQLFGAPLRIRYNKDVLSLEEVERGDFLAGPEGTDLIFSRNIRNQVGQAAVNISRFPGTGGADGGGTLITLRFRAIAPGQSSVNISPMGARNAQQQVVTIAATMTQVTVTQ